MTHPVHESRAASRALALALRERLGVAALPLHRVAAGTTLLRSGQAVTRLAFLAAGRIDAVLQGRGSDSAQVVPLAFGAGEIVLLSQLFCDRRSGVDLVASDETTLRWVPIERIERALLDDPAALLLLVKFLAQRLREVQVRERAWAERGVHERVCAALARLAAEQATRDDGRVLIVITHEQLATRSGVSRPKASTALKKLEQAGRVRLGRGAIEVLDLAALSPR
ncbi:MAG TPA: Crp/Fnr family transcriptional regulator [Burkholderiaceae bacterium]|nr:Crp/Fnr family transcriptional regulator [Burkholderiaceae bacterium]